MSQQKQRKITATEAAEKVGEIAGLMKLRRAIKKAIYLKNQTNSIEGSGEDHVKT